MKIHRSNLFEASVKLVDITLGPLRYVRGLIIKSLLMVEKGRTPEDSLRWLLDINNYIENLIDNQCVELGKGVHIKHEIMDDIHSFFYSRISAGAKVLDLGCGIGAVANAIAVHSNASVIGIDSNEAQINFARSHFNHPNLVFTVGDATRDLPDQQMDVIVLSSILEHIEDRIGMLKRLAEKYHAVKFLIRVPTFERHYHAALKQYLGMFAFTDAGHKIEYSISSFSEEIEKAGLKISFIEIRWGDIWAECWRNADHSNQSKELLNG